MDAPSWMDAEFFETLLRENDADADADIVVTSFDVSLAVGKGENYVSVLHRVALHFTKDGKPDQRYLIVKSLPESEMMVQFAKEANFFEKETHMYLTTHPALLRLQTDAGVEPTSLACACYRTSRPYTLVMDDLVRAGFQMAARREGLDLAHTRLALQGLARLHALSRKLLASDPGCMEAFTETLYVAEKRDMVQQFLDTSIHALAAKIDKWPGYEHFGDRLRKVDFVDGIIGLFERPDPKGFAVLNHGDCWVNNMMFRNSEDGQVEEIKFVDFQIARFASLAFDIHYFMYTSPKESVRIEHWDELMEEYYDAFVATSASVGQKVGFTLDDFKEEIESKTLFGLLTVCTILPIVLTDPEDAPDMTQFKDYDSYNNMEDKSAVTKPLDGERFKRVMKNSLEYFGQLGLL